MGIFEDALLRGGLEILRSLKIDLVDEEVETKARKAPLPSSAGIEVMEHALAPFPSTIILPNRLETEDGHQITRNPNGAISWSAQRAMRVDHLFLSSPDGSLDALVILSFNIGAESQMVSVGEIPARIFDAAAVQVMKLKGGVINPGLRIELRVRSYAQQPLTLAGGIRGPLVRA